MTSEDFPRGGGSATPSTSLASALRIAPVELKRVQALAERDFSASKKKKQTVEPAADLCTARPLTFKSLAVGMILLAKVKQIGDLEVEIALPNHLTAQLPITQVSAFVERQLEALQEQPEGAEFEPPRLHDFFEIGQALAVAIVELGGGPGAPKKSIQVTSAPAKIASYRSITRASGLVPGLVLAAEVASIEDRGYTLDIGVKGVVTWLSSAGCQPLSLGQLLSVQILPALKERGSGAVQVSIYRGGEKDFVAGPLLWPGQRVFGTVVSCQKYGALVELQQGVSGVEGEKCSVIVTTDCISSGGEALTEGSKISGVISRYATDDQPAGIVVAREKNTQIPDIGIKCSATIKRVDNGVGMLVQLSGTSGVLEQGPQFAYVMASKVDQGDVKEFELDSTHQARIIDYDPLDCVLHASLRHIDLTQAFVSICELRVGAVIKGKVTRVESYGLIVELGERIRGLAPTIWASPISKWHVGDTRKFMIIDLDAASKRVILTPKKAMFESSALSEDDLFVGNSVAGLVSSIRDCGAIVVFCSGLKGLVPARELSKAPALAEGKVATFTVTRASKQGGVLLKPTAVNDLSVKKEQLPLRALEDLSIGQSISGKISKIDPRSGLSVTLAVCNQKQKRLTGRVFITDISREATHPTEGFWIGQKITCTISDIKGDLIDLSMLPPNESTAVELPPVGSLISGNVINICKSGIFVAIDRSTTGRILLRELSLDFVKDWETAFKLGERVTAKIMRSLPHLDLSIKALLEEQQHEALANLDINATFDCTVISIKEYGMFMKIGATSKSGLCHISQCPRDPASGAYSVGDRVRAKIISNDPQGKIALSMLDTDCNNELEIDQDIAPDTEQNLPTKNVVTVDASTGFDWSVVDTDQSAIKDIEQSEDYEHLSEAEQEDGAQPSKHLTKRQRLLREDLIMKREIALHSQSETYATEDQLKQSLIASPHASSVYIQAMNWYIQRGLLDEARKIGRLALARIPFGLEAEKANIWLALLALEHLYAGAGSESALEALLLEARQSTNEKSFLISLARMFYHTPGSHPERSGMVYKLLTKRFPASLKAWKLRIMHSFLQGQPKEARELQKQAMRALPPRKHVKATVQWALCEHKMPGGTPEIARTHFEGLLSKFPKRLDLWIVYFQSEAEALAKCTILERVASMPWSVKKMHFILGEWMAVAKCLVDPEARTEMIKRVKDVALRFVEVQRGTQ